MHCKTFSRIPGLNPLDACGSPSLVVTQKCTSTLPTLPDVAWEAILPMVENILRNNVIATDNKQASAQDSGHLLHYVHCCLPKATVVHWEWQPLGEDLSAERMTHLPQDFHGIYSAHIGALHLSHLEHLQGRGDRINLPLHILSSKSPTLKLWYWDREAHPGVGR